MKKALLYFTAAICGIVYLLAWDLFLPDISRSIVAQNYVWTPLQFGQFVFWLGFPIWAGLIAMMVLWILRSLDK